MAAYAAVISIMNTINRLSESSHISLPRRDSEFIKLVYKEMESIRELLRICHDDDNNNNNSCREEERFNAFEGRIREAVSEFSDKLESHVTDQFLSRSEQSRSCRDHWCPFSFLLDMKKILPDFGSFSLDMKKVRPDFDSLVKNVKKMEEEYIKELNNTLPEDDDDAVSSKTDDFGEKKLKLVDDNLVSLGIDSDGKKSQIVGLSDILEKIKSLNSENRTDVAIVGMAGIGKTTLVKEVFEDPSILKQFQYRLWVTVGPKYRREEILQNILSKLHPDNSEMFLMEGEIGLRDNLRTSLKGKKYFIVLDDIWDSRVWDYFMYVFPEDSNGSRVFLTSRINTVARQFDYMHEMCLLNKEESWELLSKKMFADVSCPPQLVKSGKEIAEKCDGLPLTIVTVAGILSEREKTLEYWSEIAANKQHSIFMDAYEKISKVIISSYKYLPQKLKAYFLYMGVYPQNYVISTSKLYKLWSAEGFLEPNTRPTSENFAAGDILNKLVDANLVMALEKGSMLGTIKMCRLHSVFWYLCNREARKNKLFHISSCRADCLVEGIKSERRLSVQKGVLFGIKDAYDSLASMTILRSLLYTGPYHQYPVPICSRSKLLSVLHTLAIRFYQLPIEVLELMYLRYFAVTYNGLLPALISKLWNLQYLIIHRHLSIKSFEDSSYLPIEIWKMKELKHLEIIGSNLPDPCGARLPKLLTLLGVGAHSCTEKVFESIPNLRKLGIRIESTPDADVTLISCFDHIFHLCQLKSLKCVVVNPKLKFRLASYLNFPLSLEKLSLSGLGYPWECMGNIASLQELKVLKLRSYAFYGPTWRIDGTAFSRLHCLILEDTDLVNLDFVSPDSYISFHLIIRHCYKLKKLRRPTRGFGPIDLFDCDPSVSKQIQSEAKSCFGDVNIHSSWEEVKHQT